MASADDGRRRRGSWPGCLALISAAAVPRWPLGLLPGYRVPGTAAPGGDGIRQAARAAVGTAPHARTGTVSETQAHWGPRGAAGALPPRLRPLAERVGALASEAERDRLVGELLARLERSASLREHEALQSLLWAAWLFQGDDDVAQALRDGIQRAKASDLQGAERSLRRALLLRPDCFAAVQMLTKVCLQRGHLWEAWALFRRASALEPAHFAAMIAMGERGPVGKGSWILGLSAHRALRRARARGEGRRAADLAGFRGPAVALLAWGAELLGLLAPWLAASLAGAAVLSACAALPGAPAQGGPLGQPYAPAFSRTLSLQRVVPTGAPTPVLAEEVSSLKTNAERQELTQVLLDELAAAESGRRSLALQELVWQAWAFHEDPEICQILHRGAEFIEQRRLVEAEAYFVEAVWRDPSSTEGWFRLGQVHYLMGDHRSSLRELQVALKTEPRHFGARCAVGLNLLQLGEYGGAAAAFADAQGALPPASARFLAGDAEWARGLLSGKRAPWAGGGVQVPALGAPAARSAMFPPSSAHPQGGLPRYGVDAVNGVQAGAEGPFAFRMLQHSLEEVYAAAERAPLELIDFNGEGSGYQRY